MHHLRLAHATSARAPGASPFQPLESENAEQQRNLMSKTMKAAVFVSPGRIELREKPIPEIGPDDALLRVQKGLTSPVLLSLRRPKTR